MQRKMLFIVVSCKYYHGNSQNWEAVAPHCYTRDHRTYHKYIYTSSHRACEMTITRVKVCAGKKPSTSIPQVIEHVK